MMYKQLFGNLVWWSQNICNMPRPRPIIGLILNYRNVICCSRNISHSSFSFGSVNEPEEQLPVKYASKTMQAIFKRAEDQKKLEEKRKVDFDIGKRHLANMMGEAPENFTQDDVDRAISYLFPSGLYDPKARPMMKPPDEVFLVQKPLGFDNNGRPFHKFFYTGRPNYYSLIEQISKKAEQLQILLDRMKEKPTLDPYLFDGSSWMNKKRLEGILLEKIPTDMYDRFISLLERMMEHPLVFKEKEFIMKYRDQIQLRDNTEALPEIMHTDQGIPYVTESAKRRTTIATVIVYGRGTGKFSINGEDILYFQNPQDRRQVMFPLQLAGVLKSMDVEATTVHGGPSGQAGAIKLAVAKALRSFVPQVTVNKIRLAGLLTNDIRKKERQKPGKRGARRSYAYRRR